MKPSLLLLMMLTGVLIFPSLKAADKGPALREAVIPFGAQ